MESPTWTHLAVSARIENLADVFDFRNGRIAESEVRRVEATDAEVVVEIRDGQVVADGIGLTVRRHLVERLGLVPIGIYWSSKFKLMLPGGQEFKPIPHHAARLTVNGRNCVIDVDVVEMGGLYESIDIIIGIIALLAMGWKFDVEGNRLVEDTETIIGTAILLD
jgi:hypothetical protein